MVSKDNMGLVGHYKSYRPMGARKTGESREVKYISVATRRNSHFLSVYLWLKR